MYQEKKIKKAIHSLFTMLLPDYSQDETEEIFNMLDMESVIQAIRDKAETIFAYQVGGSYKHAFVYFGSELIPKRGRKLFESINYMASDIVLTSHVYELWLLNHFFNKNLLLRKDFTKS